MPVWPKGLSHWQLYQSYLPLHCQYLPFTLTAFKYLTRHFIRSKETSLARSSSFSTAGGTIILAKAQLDAKPHAKRKCVDAKMCSLLGFGRFPGLQITGIWVAEMQLRVFTLHEIIDQSTTELLVHVRQHGSEVALQNLDLNSRSFSFLLTIFQDMHNYIYTPAYVVSMVCSCNQTLQSKPVLVLLTWNDYKQSLNNLNELKLLGYWGHTSTPLLLHFSQLKPKLRHEIDH